MSLDKAYSEAEVLTWAAHFKSDLVASPKIDGLACAIHYDGQGRLTAAATRGDGKRGELITANIAFVGGVPQAISRGHGQAIEVRGEVYQPLSVFATMQDRFANPRNVAAGAIKQKDAERTAEFGLKFLAYDLLGLALASEREKRETLTSLGFTTVESHWIERNLVQETYQVMLAARPHWDYETDGVVFKIDSAEEQRLAGTTAHHPRYAIAYKFQGDAGTTTLQDVEWSVSRTGLITPVALIAPVELSGAMVSRVSLHNLGLMQGLSLRRGDQVHCVRRGGVIPHLEGVALTNPQGASFAPPAHCPSCGGALGLQGDFLVCSARASCPAQVSGRLEHFAKAVEMEGFGPRWIEALVQAGLLRTPADFYRLELADLLTLDRMGEKLAQNLLGQVRRTRTLPMTALLIGLGIDDLGQQVAELLAQHWSLEQLRELSEEQLATQHSIGPVKAKSIVVGLAAQAVLLSDLLKVIEVKAPSAPTSDGPLAGKKVVFTGTMASMNRSEAQKRVRALGGQTPSAVGRDLDYLVVGDTDSALLDSAQAKSSKHKTALKNIADSCPTQIIPEADFLKLLHAVNT